MGGIVHIGGAQGMEPPLVISADFAYYQKRQHIRPGDGVEAEGDKLPTYCQGVGNDSF